MFDPTDIHARILELKHRVGDQFWESLKICLTDYADEMQDVVNDLRTDEKTLMRTRIELHILTGFISGELIDVLVQRMESKLKRDEEKAISLMEGDRSFRPKA